MTKRQGDGQRPAESVPPERCGGDPLGLATLAGVVAVLMLSFANWRDVWKDAELGRLNLPVPAGAPAG